jgi:CubicO group peptidase (beta-lactamase class C family)
MSVTKSVVGCLAGVLVGSGRLDAGAPVTQHVPELAGTGYDRATVRQVLDMRSGVRFREEYTNPDSEIRIMDRWIGSRPAAPDEEHRGLYAYLRTLTSHARHGGVFDYRSSESDVLGWVCERAAGQRMADLLADLLWRPMGTTDDADLVCDGVGTAIHDGGLCATLRDVARFGQLLLDDGRVGQGADAVQVVPAEWLVQARAVDSDVRQAFASSPAEQSFPGGWYRSQLWFRPGRFGDVVLALGIHGQLVHVNRRTRTVCVKLSSWPQPQLPALLLDTVRACDAVGGYLAGLADDAASTTGTIGVVSGTGRRLGSRSRPGGAM